VGLTASKHTEEELLEYLHRLARTLGHSPRVVDLERESDAPPLSRFEAVFGSWNQAKEQAGLETFRKEGRGEPYTDEQLLDLLRKRDQEIEGSVSIQDINNAEGYPSAVTYQRRFGSWNEAKQKAGLETVAVDDPRPEYTDEELLALLKEVAENLDRPLTIRDIEEIDDFPDHATFERRFGSWNQAKQKAGLKTLGKGKGSRSPSYSEEELLQTLRDLADKVGEPVTERDLAKVPNFPGYMTYIRRFGSWTNAKKKAGIE
jgi:hypothetical protein